jgi:arginine utilization protein RocB
MLGHYDTVGVSEYTAFGMPGGDAVAFQPDALRQRLLDRAAGPTSEAARRAEPDLAEERASPGTWMFGRGSLDMKSGLAAGLAAFGALAGGGRELPGSVLFVACPDEERESSGMRVAVPELVQLRDSHGLDFAGALNLDFSTEPAAYAGVVGKRLLGLWVLGEPTHVSEPLGGADAAQLAAAIVNRITLGTDLVEEWGELASSPPAVLRMRDLKEEYNVQTAREAIVELNLMTFARPLAPMLETVRGAVIAALADWGRARRARGRANAGDPPEPVVLLYPELLERAGLAPGADPFDADSTRRDARPATLERVRRLAHVVGLSGPAVVVMLLPPFYPHAAPGDGPFTRAARRVLEREGVPVRPFYRHISDASYLAWRDEPADVVARFLPAFGREYEVPTEAAAALDLDVVNLGPWGRDAHGAFERVYAPYAFGRLPRLIVETVRAAFDE